MCIDPKHDPAVVQVQLPPVDPRGDGGAKPAARASGELAGGLGAARGKEAGAREAPGGTPEGDRDAEGAKERRRRERQMAARARFGADAAARSANGFIHAKMVRARMLHHAILRLIGASICVFFL